MEKQSKKGRVLSGRYEQAITDFFSDRRLFTIGRGWNYYEQVEAVCEVIEPVFKDILTHGNIISILSTAVAESIEFFSSENFSEKSIVSAREKAVAHIIQKFAAYPCDYTCEVEVPRLFLGGVDGSELDLPQGMRITLPKSGQSSAVLTLRGSGYFSPGSKSPYSTGVVRIVKIFLFLLRPFTAGKFVNFGIRGRATVHADSSSYSGKLELPNGLDWMLGSLTLLMPIMRSETKSVFVHENDFESEFKNTLLAQLSVIGTLLDKSCERIGAAIEWYIDSITAENQTVALLGVCIGLEALLGEEEDMSEMTKRLCDRLAFTLGRTRVDRAKYFDDYMALLKLRGKLVHSKIFQLQREDGKVLERGRTMLNQMIMHEIAHL